MTNLLRCGLCLLLLMSAGLARAAEDLALLSRRLRVVDPAALERAIADLSATHPGVYPGAAFTQRLGRLERALPALRERLRQGDATAGPAAVAWLDLQREALLANPLLAFDEVLLVRRAARQLGLPTNWTSNSSLPKTGYRNEIAALALRTKNAAPRPVYRPEHDGFVGDLELHWDGRRLLFSQSEANRSWQVHEIGVDGGGRRQVTPDIGPDVDNYDACYLPQGDIIFMSTASMVAVPCVNGNAAVANLYRLAADGGVRQLCFDQEHDWGPTVMNDGRVMYLRWEYADIPHANSRRLFQMNPDGTGQIAFYGSNSFWPNSVFFSRPIPGRNSQAVGVVTGHHGLARMGELVLFDVERGHREAEGAVQRIPGFGRRVERVVKDNLADDSWPRFLHPWPLGRDDGVGSGKYFLVSCQPAADAPWGIYLVDVFDNLLLLREEPGEALLEPVPLATRTMPPRVADRVDPAKREAEVYIADLYSGPGLAGIPRGEVKSLRVFSYVYGYRGMGGMYGTIGMNGPWDIRRILGTVPVEPDGSASFRIPANTPIALQPLDQDGQALQLMRSWFVGMPGEVVSCIGCHEDRRNTPPPRPGLAARQAPRAIEPWYGPARGFAFAREVQPVLDAACVSCHNGVTTYAGRPTLNLRGDQPLEGWKSVLPGSQSPKWGGKFTVGYANLFRFIRASGIESGIGLLTPTEFHAEGSELVQMLRKGHFDVKLNPEQWDRLVTWIDLNAPFHGDWHTIAGEEAHRCEVRRAELRRKFSGIDEFHLDVNAPPPVPADPATFVAKVPVQPAVKPPREAPRSGPRARPAQVVDLGGGAALEFRYVPAGSFSMGGGLPDESPAHPVRIERGFWLASTELTNAQFARFDPAHDSGHEHLRGYAFGMEGYPLNQPAQPVVRVSWHRAVEFCAWLARRTGLKVNLPTEAQWEYACRAGTATPFHYGQPGANFPIYANFADLKTREFAADSYLRTVPTPLSLPGFADDYLPKDERFHDGALVASPVGGRLPNAWGFFDLHGNVSEWTRSVYQSYPYREDDGRNDLRATGRRVVRGGSWRDRPFRGAAGFRHVLPAHLARVDVGFRVVVDEDRVEFPGVAPLAAQ